MVIPTMFMLTVQIENLKATVGDDFINHVLMQSNGFEPDMAYMTYRSPVPNALWLEAHNSETVKLHITNWILTYGEDQTFEALEMCGLVVFEFMKNNNVPMPIYNEGA